MKRLLLAASLTLVVLGSAWAEPWSHKGADWSTGNGFVVTVPKEMKTVMDSDGLTAKNNDAYSAFMPALPSMTPEAVLKKLDKDVPEKFPGVLLAPLKTSSRKGMTVKIRQGSFSKQSMSFVLTYGEFVKGKNSLGFLTVVVKNDKVGVPLLNKIMGSVRPK